LQGVVGNVLEETVREIWKGEALRKVRVAHLDGDYAKIPCCSRCDYWAQGRDDISQWLAKNNVF